jgi:DNA-binding NtrC family response regulator
MTVRVLVVDDEPDVEVLFRQQFRRELRELAGHVGEQIDLLVSDINMPGMSGLDLLPEVKARRPDLPVFMISAYGDGNTMAAALARGAARFMTKPVDFPRLKRDVSIAVADARGNE